MTPSFLFTKKRINHNKIIDYLSKNKIAFDIKNFRTMQEGIRIWNGPNIKKNDLIALTNWLDWCFNRNLYKVVKSQLLPEGFRDSLPDMAGKEYLINSSFLNLMKKNGYLLIKPPFIRI